MQYLYIDESGSMTNSYTESWPYFVIAIVWVEKPDELRGLHKRFAAKYLDELEKSDLDGKMFKDGRLKELKGSAFTPDLKRNFVSFVCRKETFQTFYIIIDNRKISDNLYTNKARAFNYVFKLALEYFIQGGALPDDEYIIQLDERNERTNTRHFLQDYLNTELRMKGVLSNDIKVQYFDSSQNKIIQIADVLANLYYSQLRTGNYEKEIRKMRNNECLKKVFYFPLEHSQRKDAEKT